MIGAIIIDDEPHCIERLGSMLQPYAASGLALWGAWQTAEEGIAQIKERRPQLVFLDVKLGARSGFDVLRETSGFPIEVIFTTAYDTYAVQAFKCSALDYLLKPINEDDLARAVRKALQKQSDSDTAAKIDTLLHNLRAGSKKICVPDANGYVFLQVADIVRCQSDGNYTRFFLRDGSKLLASRTLKDFEDMLTGYGFFRIHNSHLVNLEHIKSYNRSQGGYVIMADNFQAEVAGRRREEFVKALKAL